MPRIFIGSGDERPAKRARRAPRLSAGSRTDHAGGGQYDFSCQCGGGSWDGACICGGAEIIIPKPLPIVVSNELAEDDDSLCDTDSEIGSNSDADCDLGEGGQSDTTQDSYVDEVLARRETVSDDEDESTADRFAVGLVDGAVLMADKTLSGKDQIPDGKGKLFCGHAKEVRFAFLFSS